MDSRLRRDSATADLVPGSARTHVRRDGHEAGGGEIAPRRMDHSRRPHAPTRIIAPFSCVYWRTARRTGNFLEVVCSTEGGTLEMIEGAPFGSEAEARAAIANRVARHLGAAYDCDDCTATAWRPVRRCAPAGLQ